MKDVRGRGTVVVAVEWRVNVTSCSSITGSIFSGDSCIRAWVPGKRPTILSGLEKILKF